MRSVRAQTPKLPSRTRLGLWRAWTRTRGSRSINSGAPPVAVGILTSSRRWGSHGAACRSLSAARATSSARPTRSRRKCAGPSSRSSLNLTAAPPSSASTSSPAWSRRPLIKALWPSPLESPQAPCPARRRLPPPRSARRIVRTHSRSSTRPPTRRVASRSRSKPIGSSRARRAASWQAPQAMAAATSSSPSAGQVPGSS